MFIPFSMIVLSKGRKINTAMLKFPLEYVDLYMNMRRYFVNLCALDCGIDDFWGKERNWDEGN